MHLRQRGNGSERGLADRASVRPCSPKSIPKPLDEVLADQVWEAWDAENLTDGAACIAWLLIAGLVSRRNR